MGIFGSLFSQKKKPAKSKQRSSAKSSSKSSASTKSIAQLRAEMEAEDRRFNRVMDKVNGALEACQESDWSEESLEKYRLAIVQARKDGINLSTAHDFRLINGYIKRKMYDTAWGYLNRMVIDFPDDLWKIRKEMCRICKKEGRWVDALGFLMMSHASKFGGFKEGAFLKDLGPIARKLSMTEDEKQYLADMLAKLKGNELKRDADASTLHRKFYEERLKPRMEQSG